MITEQDLQQAIAECQGERNPNAYTCIKLAAFYALKDQMYGEEGQERLPNIYSYDTGPQYPNDTLIKYENDSEFATIVFGMPTDKVMSVIDELMDTLKVLQPRLYNGVIGKLEKQK